MVMEPEAINEFMNIYEQTFNIRLSEEEAKFKAKKLLQITRKAIFNNLIKEINDNE
mgnify:CR=1 FL=1